MTVSSVQDAEENFKGRKKNKEKKKKEPFKKKAKFWRKTRRGLPL